MQIIRRIKHGVMIPRFWGFAWQEHYRHGMVIMPIPLNYLANWGRAFLHFLDYGILVKESRRDAIYLKAAEIADRKMRAARERTENIGYRRGAQEMIQAVMRSMSEGDDTEMKEVEERMKRVT